MYGILARNSGMWGFESLCTDNNGNVLQFKTKEEAQAKINEWNNKRNQVNNFTQYFVTEID